MAKKYWIYKGQKIPVNKYRPSSYNVKTGDELYREVIRKTKQANRRLRNIKREMGTLGWAGNILKNKTQMHLVDTWSSRGVRIKKDTSEKQLRATLRALKNFLGSKTSTVKGIKETIKKQQEGLRRTLSTDEIDISTEESKIIYSFFGDKDFDYITDRVYYRDLLANMQDAREQNDSKEQFIKRLENYNISGNDRVMKEAIGRIYDKFIKA